MDGTLEECSWTKGLPSSGLTRLASGVLVPAMWAVSAIALASAAFAIWRPSNLTFLVAGIANAIAGYLLWG